MSASRDDVTLISVIGAVEESLLVAFVEHYRSLGVNTVRLGFHFTPTVTSRVRRRLVALAGQLGAAAPIVSEGPWRVETNGLIRDELRRRADSRWHVLADADEFQAHPGGIGRTVARCEANDHPFAVGLLVDRFADRALTLVSMPASNKLDETFPQGSFFTHHVLDGDPRKLTVVRDDIAVGSGQHHAPEHTKLERLRPLPVHHFKWTREVRSYLRARAGYFIDSEDPSEASMRHEAMAAERALDAPDLDQRGPGALAWFDASLRRLPEAWTEIATPVWEHWQVTRWERDEVGR